jgi:hypothetical protein
MALCCRKKLRQLRDAWYAGLSLTVDEYADLRLETKHFIYFYLGHCAILLFKTQ